jgi:AAA domain
MMPHLFVDQIRQPRTYHHDLFVNRESETEMIAAKVRAAQGNFVADPIINFWGVKGIGKTWLLHELRRRYAYHMDVPSAALSLSPPTFALLYTFPDEPSVGMPDQVARTLADEAAVQLSSVLFPQEHAELTQARDKQDIDALVKLLISLSRRFVPLILLDNTDKVRQDDWEQLETSLIEPLVRTGRVLVVIAGRRQIPRWRRFEVRRRVMEVERSRIEPFDKQAVSRQLERHKYQIPVELFFPYTAGNPHLVDAIAHHIARWQIDTESGGLNQAWFDRHQNGLLQILRASEAQLLENVSTVLLPILDAVSLLRFYRIEALRYMLVTQGIEPENRPDAYYLNLLRALDQYEVMWWDRARRAYVTSQVIRQLIGQRQLLENREQYIVKHREAVQMYWNWVREYPKASEDFIGEILFHLACLYSADGDINELRSEAQAALRFAHKHLNPDRLLVVQMQLNDSKNDHELHDLLPEDVRNDLIRELDRLQAKKPLSNV